MIKIEPVFFFLTFTYHMSNSRINLSSDRDFEWWWWGGRGVGQLRARRRRGELSFYNEHGESSSSEAYSVAGVSIALICS